MKTLLIALLASASLATPACAGQAADEAAAPAATERAAPVTKAKADLPDADPAMWVVKDEDTTIYLFGTFHLLDGKTDWFNDEVKQAFDRSNELVLEVLMPENEQEIAAAMQPLIMKYALDPEGRKVSADLSEAENKILNDAFATMGVPPGGFDMFEPWFVAMSLTGVTAKKLNMSGDQGAETVLRRAAKGRDIAFGAVETLEGQIKIFDTMPREMQVTQLKEALENMAEAETMMTRMLDVWNKGDTAGLEAVMNEGLRENPALRKALLEDRNRAWVEWIDQRLDKPGTVFMAVGAGHLVGPDSVQAFLKQRGIDSARVPNLTPAG